MNEYNILTNPSGSIMLDVLDVFKESRLAATDRRLGDGETARRPTPGGYVFRAGKAYNDLVQGMVERQTRCRALLLSARIGGDEDVREYHGERG